jgi:hypothetical protein
LIAEREAVSHRTRLTTSAAMLGAARSLVSRASTRGLKSSVDLLPPLKVAVTGAAGQIGYALVMRIARYVMPLVYFSRTKCNALVYS